MQAVKSDEKQLALVIFNIQSTTLNIMSQLLLHGHQVLILIDQPKDLIKVATRRSGIGNCEADNFLGIDYEHRSDLHTGHFNSQANTQVLEETHSKR